MKCFFICILLSLFSCAKADEKNEPSAPTDEINLLFNQAADRLVSLLDRGLVVSRSADNAAQHKGDSLIWSGIAIGAMPCDKVAVISDALISMIEENQGGLYRHWDLKESISMDGAMGLYKGVSSLLVRCPEFTGQWREAMALHKKFAEENGDKMNAASSVKLPAEFTYVRDLLFHRLGIRGKPSGDRLKILENQITAWVAGVKASKSACFRVNLSLVSYQAIESSGGSISATGRNNFCGLTKGMDLPTVDHWCGRDDLKDWVKGFTWNIWEYRHQRCGAWETPDGKGLLTPGVDLLEGINQAYSI